MRPDARVIYNDYDNYSKRIEHILNTNKILFELREMTRNLPYRKILPKEVRREILDLLKQRELKDGFVDYITLSSSLLFSMRYATSWDEMAKENFYNKVVKSDYDATGYLDGLEITHCDYRDMFDLFKDTDDVVFLVDPPYLSTDIKSYVTCTWRLGDYLDILRILDGHHFVYFTSNKSQIIELCEWMETYKPGCNVFEGAQRSEHVARMNHNSKYTDIMLYKM